MFTYRETFFASPGNRTHLGLQTMLTCEDDCDDWFEAELTVEDEFPSRARGAESLDPTGYANGTTQDTATSIPKHAFRSLS
jgi:hypothetical protein